MITKDDLEPVVTHYDYLMQRWDDERGYEPWGDYKKAMRKFLAARGCTLVTMTEADLVYRTARELVHVELTPVGIVSTAALLQ